MKKENGIWTVAVAVAVLFIAVMCGAFAAQFHGAEGLVFPYSPQQSEKPVLQIVISSLVALRPLALSAVAASLPFGWLLPCIVAAFYLFSFSYTVSLMTMLGFSFVTAPFYDALFSFLIAFPCSVLVSFHIRRREIAKSFLLTAFSFIAVLSVKCIIYLVTVL